MLWSCNLASYNTSGINVMYGVVLLLCQCVVMTVVSCVCWIIIFLHGVRGGIDEIDRNMSSTRLPPPGEFDFLKPDKWPKWRKWFEQYRSESGLDAESESHQVDTLLYCLGSEVDNVLASTNFSAEDRKKYWEVIGNLTPTRTSEWGAT